MSSSQLSGLPPPLRAGALVRVLWFGVQGCGSTFLNPDTSTQVRAEPDDAQLRDKPRVRDEVVPALRPTPPPQTRDAR